MRAGRCCVFATAIAFVGSARALHGFRADSALTGFVATRSARRLMPLRSGHLNAFRFNCLDGKRSAACEEGGGRVFKRALAERIPRPEQPFLKMTVSVKKRCSFKFLGGVSARQRRLWHALIRQRRRAEQRLRLPRADANTSVNSSTRAGRRDPPKSFFLRARPRAKGGDVCRVGPGVEERGCGEPCGQCASLAGRCLPAAGKAESR